MHINLTVMKSVPVADRIAAQALINVILSMDLARITINNGDEDMVKKSYRSGEIYSAMASGDEDFVIVHNVKGERLGCFYLVYNNGNEWDPAVLISDYTANDFCDFVYDRVAEETGSEV